MNLKSQFQGWPYYGAPNHATTAAASLPSRMAGGGVKHTNSGIWDDRADNQLPPIDPETHLLSQFLLPSTFNKVRLVPEYFAKDDVGSTLSLLYEEYPDAMIQNIGNYLKERGSNTIFLIMIDLQPISSKYPFICSPYVGNNSPQFDNTKLARWERIFRKAYEAGMPITPIWVCDDQNLYIKKEYVQYHKPCIAEMVKRFDQYVTGWCVGMESSKFDHDGAYTNQLAGYFKEFSRKPIGNHIVYNHASIMCDKPNIDVIYLENSWNPDDGTDTRHDSKAVVNEGADVARHGKAWIAAEYNFWSSTPKACAQGRAACAAGAYGALNGF